MVEEKLGRIEQCLENINEKLDVNAQDHKELKESINRKTAEKVDKDIYDMTVGSQTRRIAEVEAKVDRAWEELVREQNNLGWIMEFKKRVNTAAYAALGVIVTIFGLIGFIAYEAYSRLKSH